MNNLNIINRAEESYRLAIQCIFKKDILGFSNNLKNAYDILPSGLERFYDENEFQEILDKKVWSTYFIHKLISDTDYLFRGFLYLGLQEYDKAQKNLSDALEINSSQNDLPYLLRGSIPEEYNSHKRNDLTIAMMLRSSFRSYFLFYQILKENENHKEDSFSSHIPSAGNRYFSLRPSHYNSSIILEIFNRILEITPDPIVYFERSSHQKSRELEDEDLINSFNIDSNYLPTLLKVYKVFYYKSDYKSCLTCLLKLINLTDYSSSQIICKKIANCYFHLNNFKQASKYYKKSFTTPNFRSLDEHANNEFYDPTHFFRYFYPKYSWDNDLLNYFICLIKNNQSNFSLEEGNIIFDKLMDLRNSFQSELGSVINQEELEKKITSGKISKEAVNAGRMIFYGFNHKLNFGTYKREKIIEILKHNPNYLINCILNLTHFSVEPEIFLNEKIKTNPKFLKALEVNLIKMKVLALAEYEEERDWANTESESHYYPSNESYYDGGGGSEWSDPFTFLGG
ncbi:hypothetical protein [Gelidibacter japonicus]|uniref:hypothetical protein n=1 Tax=Gelidibacter japonicus TaxID=1962232 RepID=UPI003A8FF62E